MVMGTQELELERLGLGMRKTQAVGRKGTLSYLLRGCLMGLQGMAKVRLGSEREGWTKQRLGMGMGMDKAGLEMQRRVRYY